MTEILDKRGAPIMTPILARFEHRTIRGLIRAQGYVMRVMWPQDLTTVEFTALDNMPMGTTLEGARDSLDCFNRNRAARGFRPVEIVS